MKWLVPSLIALAVLTGLAVAGPAGAAPVPAPALSAEDTALVQKAAALIQSLNSVQGRFTQTNARGGTSTGTFSLQRPGKARFEYDPDGQLLIVSDGYNVKVFDRRLKTFDQYPLGSTPLGLLLAREIRLDRGVAVIGVQRTAGGFSITLRDARKQAEGSLSLQFSDAPLALRGWTVIDAQGLQTRVQLGALTPVARLDPKLFQLQDPKRRGGPH